jgi:hypothetical protein
MQHSKLLKLCHDASLAEIDVDGGDVSCRLDDVVCAFDFDQTLKMKSHIIGQPHTIRGGAKSIEALARWKQRGCRLIVITAADVSSAGARSIGAELNQLKVGELFDVDESSFAPIFDYWRQQPDNAALSDDDLLLKLMVLLALRSTKYPLFSADIARIRRDSVGFEVKTVPPSSSSSSSLSATSTAILTATAAPAVVVASSSVSTSTPNATTTTIETKSVSTSTATTVATTHTKTTANGSSSSDNKTTTTVVSRNVVFRLVRNGTLGAKQTLPAIDAHNGVDRQDDVKVDLFECWSEYHRRVDARRTDDNWRYFVTFIDNNKNDTNDEREQAGTAVATAAIGDDDSRIGARIEALVNHFLTQRLARHYSNSQIARIIRNTAHVHNVNGVQIARYGNVFCSKYNKASDCHRRTSLSNSFGVVVNNTNASLSMM